MNDGKFSKVALGFVISCGTFIFGACGAGLSGTYTNPTGLVTLDLRSGGAASLTMMGQNEQCTYDVSGRNLTLTCGGDKTVWGIHDDGSLTGPGFVGTLAKVLKAEDFWRSKLAVAELLFANATLSSAHNFSHFVGQVVWTEWFFNECGTRA